MKDEKKRSLTGMILAACGIGLCLYGAYRGEINVVFAKATRICMECIGIG